jgi:hypothetical protein
MKKKIVLLVILVIGFAAGNVLANNLLNPGFELGDTGRFDPQNVTSWTTFGTNGWHTDHNSINDVNGIHSGVKAVKIWQPDTYLYQDCNVVVGKMYNFSVWAITQKLDDLGLHGKNGVFAVQWLDSAKTTILSTDIIGYFYGGTYTVPPPTVTGGDPCNTWKFISGMAAAPTGASYGRVRLYIEIWGAPGGSVCWDDASVTWRYAASYPEPADDPLHLVPLVPFGVTALSWTRPAPRQPGDTIRCDVWFGTDSNMPGTNTKILNKQDANSVAISSLASHQDYYWRVDCYDPNTPGPEIKSEGETWTFNTAGNCVSYMPGDINGDCYVNFADVEEMAANWLKCNDESNPQCQ